LTLAFTSSFIGAFTYQRIEPVAGTLRTDLAAGEDAIWSITERELIKFEGGSGCPFSGSIWPSH